MKIYGHPLSPPSRLVTAFANLLSLDFIYVQVDLMAGGSQTPEYTLLNPNQRVPLLEEEDGFVLTETMAILRYLADKYPGGHQFYPTDTKKRAELNMHLGILNDLRSAGQLYILGKVWSPIMGLEFPEPIIEGKHATMQKVLKEYDELLADKEYVLFGEITLVDLTLMYILFVNVMLKGIEDPLAIYPNLNRYFTKHLE